MKNLGALIFHFLFSVISFFAGAIFYGVHEKYSAPDSTFMSILALIVFGMSIAGLYVIYHYKDKD